jgi:hypothetical protein
MRPSVPTPVRSRFVKIAALTGCVVLLLTSGALAGPSKVVQATASGAIVSQQPCSATEVCQQATVSGTATVLGHFVGTLSERVDVFNGTYTGTAVFTTPDGSTIATDYTGQVTPPDEQGAVFFSERHEVVSGTGKYANASGNLDVTGTADAAGQIQIVGTGTLSK